MVDSVAPVAPVITAASYDQASYVSGQKMTLKVSYTPGESSNSQSSSVVGTDPASGLSASMSVTFTVLSPDTLTWVITDNKGRVYTQVSDDGSTATFTAVA